MTRLQEDLLNDFTSQKQTVAEEAELYDSLGRALGTTAAQKLADNSWLICMEILFYLAASGALTLTIVMNRLYPFADLVNVRYIRSAEELLLLKESEYFSIAVHGMSALMTILFYAMARMTRKIRLKNRALAVADRNTKALMGLHLRRKASIQGLWQRHFSELPLYEAAANVTLVNDNGVSSTTVKH